MKLNKQFWGAVAILVGTVIGAGIFGLPYAISRIGFIPGIFYLLLLAGIVLVVNFCFTEVVLRTNGHYQMAGYAKKYLGNWGKILLTLSLILGIYSASAAYLAGIGIFLFNIFQPVIGGSLIIYSVLFWIIISILIFWGVKFMAKLELVMAIMLILVVGVIFIFAFPHLNANNLATIDLSHWFFPFGVILFALGGATAIPMMQQLLRKKEILLKKAIIIGLIVPVL
ncbi:MAG: hypothetical protein KAS12_07310, partial [Candidatus Aenigmarchaeota archaeon]|nr:hypothetical protein [Candidatus Aenigmarchaeota archaeon]